MLPVAKDKIVDSNTKIESIIGDFNTLFTKKKVSIHTTQMMNLNRKVIFLEILVIILIKQSLFLLKYFCSTVITKQLKLYPNKPM